MCSSIALFTGQPDGIEATKEHGRARMHADTFQPLTPPRHNVTPRTERTATFTATVFGAIHSCVTNHFKFVTQMDWKNARDILCVCVNVCGECL